MFDDQQFSKDLKIQKEQYKEQLLVDSTLINQHILALAEVDLEAIQGDAAKKAFWINVYNGLTNYWIIKKKIRKTMLEKPTIFFLSKCKIGGFFFSLDAIEHGLLRKNPRQPYRPFPAFWWWDQRLRFQVDKLDYRIHFALNCGGQSCPPIAFYDKDNIDKQLTMAEENFKQAEFKIDSTKKIISCSKIYKWYRQDFPNIYVNHPDYKNYKIKTLPYNFAI